MHKMLSSYRLLSISQLISLGYLFCNQEINFNLHPTKDVNNTKTTFLFAHGMFENQTQGHQFSHYLKVTKDSPLHTNKHWLFAGPVALFNFYDARKNFFQRYDRNFSTVGQETDIECLAQAHAKLCQAMPDSTIVGAGLSRGSVTWINFMATHRPANVGALILDSPFDHFNSVIKHLLNQAVLPIEGKMFTLGKNITHIIFPKLNMQGTFPIDVIANLPLDLPVLIVHSRTDRVIPVNSARRLYMRLLETGHTNAYLCELFDGKHGKLLSGPYAKEYRYVTHAFLNNFNYPCNKKWAAKGQDILALCQPSSAIVNMRISIFGE